MFSPLIVHIDTHRVLNRFGPALALGAAIDGGESGETARAFTARNLRAMRGAGLGALTYRLRTELAGEAWHWNPAGRFSDSDRGYWTSDARARKPIRLSYGYRLPRRGNTIDQANDDGYSRLDDGRPDTFWKSNPYLDDRPQWLLVDLERPQPVDAIRVRWAAPYALRYRVEYWDGENGGEFGNERAGRWRSFPCGEFRGRGGDEARHLGAVERPVEYVRLRLLASSHTPVCPHDPRDAKGFAVREIAVGQWRAGAFVDAMRHRPDRRQTPCYVSSTDPWHRASDRDPRTEQPGLDLVARSRLACGLPLLLPMPVLYGTPEDDAALARWLRRRRYPMRGFEMGEEPDGQACAPEDYGALYLRMADAIRRALPRVPLGGPGFQTVESDYAAWVSWPPETTGSPSWLRRLTAFLDARKRGRDLAFVSFEWYPFDDVRGDPAVQLARHDALLRSALARLRAAGRPLLITEYGYSAFGGPAEEDLSGALLNLEVVGTFLSEGGRATFLYGYPPATLIQEVPGVWGNLALFLSGEDGQWRDRLPTYWTTRMMTRDWCGADSPPRSDAEERIRTPGGLNANGMRRGGGWSKRPTEKRNGVCALLPATSSDSLLAAYALRRPDGRLAVLMLNKDSLKGRTVHLDAGGHPVTWGNLVRYGPAQYAWHPDGPHGRPSRSLPPSRSTFAGTITLPPFSATVATFSP